LTHKVRFSVRALQDRSRLIEFLAAESPGSLARALDLLDRAFLQLAEFPFSGMAVSRTGRRLIVRFGKGGYEIRYRVFADTVLVSRLFHTREAR
jgi:plasmid stabilization system protein ParE